MYYDDRVMEYKPEFRKIGTYFGKHNAESIADTYRKGDHEVVVTCSELSHLGMQGYDFYSVWVKDISLVDKLIAEGIFD